MRGIGAATATLVLAASLASCGQSPTLPDSEVSTSAYTPTPVSNLTAAQEAEGFKDAGNGLAYRWTTTTGGCEYGHCTTMEVLTSESGRVGDCPQDARLAARTSVAVAAPMPRMVPPSS